MDSRSRRFRAELGESVADLILSDGEAEVNGESYHYSLQALSDRRFHLLLNGKSYSVFLTPVGDHTFRILINGKATDILVKSEREILLEDYGLDHGAGKGEKAVRAPMPGLVLSTLVRPGDPVKRGDGLLVLEAMKMENEIRASADGLVKAVHVRPGDAVVKDAVLVELE